MWLSKADRIRRPLAIRLTAAAGMALALAGVAGCTVTPLYGTRTASITAPQDSPAARLASIEVAPAQDRVGQEMRNHLIFLLGSGQGQPANPAYRLQVATTTHTSSSPSVSTSRVTLTPTAGFVTVRGDYTLTEAQTGKVISAGVRVVQAPYDIPGQNYAAQRAVRDAQNRGARELAEILRLVVAQELERATATVAPDIVTTPEDVDARRSQETGSFPRRG